MTINFSTPPNDIQSFPVSSGAADLRGVISFSVDPRTGEVKQEGTEGSPRTCAARENAQGAGVSGLLVLNAEFASNYQNVGKNGIFARVSRRFELQDVARHLLPDHRIKTCLRWRFSIEQGIGVNYAEAVKRAHYSNLQTCARPWVCPVCAAKISERQRLELRQGVDTWRDRGGSIILVTLTMQHNSQDKLKDLILAQSSAYRELKSGRWWQNFEEVFRIVGNVTAHEITYGQKSGFHPHKHILFFSEGKFSIHERIYMWCCLNERWTDLLEKRSRFASDEVGVDVQEGYGDISEYVAKWGLVEEVTKTNSKIGRSSEKSQHFSPFQLLDLVKDGSSWAGPVFQEYAAAVKGVHRLRWSPRLRQLLDLGKELTDQEILEKQEQKAVLLLTLAWPEWKVVLKARARAQVLEIASMGDPDLIRVYLDALFRVQNE